MIDGGGILCYAYPSGKAASGIRYPITDFHKVYLLKCNIFTSKEEDGTDMGKTPKNFPIPLDKTSQFDYYEF